LALRASITARRKKLGWDAYARVPKHGPKRARVLAAFKEAAEDVVRSAGTCDGLLAAGGLDVSNCGTELSEATGWSVYSEEGWSAELTRGLAGDADWGAPGPERRWANHSARAFLETCVKHGIGVDFSW
jgi:hypothetical protein